MTKNEYNAKMTDIYLDIANKFSDLAIVCAETYGVSNEIVSKYIDIAREYNNMARLYAEEIE